MDKQQTITEAQEQWKKAWVSFIANVIQALRIDKLYEWIDHKLKEVSK